MNSATAASWVSAAVAGVGLAIVAIQLAFSGRAAQRERVRLRRKATIDFYTETLLARHSLIETLPSDYDQAAISREIDSSKSNGELAQHIRSYLGYWELLATAVDLDVLDADTVHAIASNRVQQVVQNYATFIQGVREEYNRPTLFANLERLAARMKKQDLSIAAPTER